MARFVRTYKVRFEDCDLAGIVFFPNYFLMLNRLVEDWFSDALGVPLRVLHHDRRQGVPTISMQVAFKKACLLDDMLEWSLEVLRIGTKSFTLAVTARCNGEERVAIEPVMVSVDLIEGGVSSREISDDIRIAMKAFLVDREGV